MQTFALRHWAALLSALVSCAAGASSLAPFVLQTAGAVEIKYSGYLARSVAPAAGPGLREASFGAGYVNSISEYGNPAQQLWRSGQHNQTISFMLYGAADAAVLPGPGAYGNQVLGSGCTQAAAGCDGKIHLDFYLDQLVGGTNPGFGIGGIKAAQRQGFDRMGALTDGQLLMRWEFVPGLAVGPGGMPVTLYQQLSGMTSPSSGYGNYLADCVGGPACSYFRSGAQQSGADFFGAHTMSALLALTAIGQNGWSTRLSDTVVTQVALAQPSTGWLLPLGILALAALRRRPQRGW